MADLLLTLQETCCIVSPSNGNRNTTEIHAEHGGFMARDGKVKAEPVLSVRLGRARGPLRRKIKRAAKLQGVTLSAFVRRAAIDAADIALQSLDPKPGVSQNDTPDPVEVAA